MGVSTVGVLSAGRQCFELLGSLIAALKHSESKFPSDGKAKPDLPLPNPSRSAPQWLDPEAGDQVHGYLGT